jgi:hypothetical protein
MSINRETWIAVREDYIRGRGSLSTVARKHGLKRGSVEKRARKEDWTGLRREFEARQLEKIIPPMLPSLPPVPVAPGGVVSSMWLAERQELYYRENTALLDKARKLLDAKLSEQNGGSADSLAKLTSALSGIVTAESQLLGLRDRRRDKRRSRAWTDVMPIEPIPANPDSDAVKCIS